MTYPMSLGTDLLAQVNEQFPAESMMKPFFQRDLEEFIADKNDSAETLRNYVDDMKMNKDDYDEQDQADIRALSDMLKRLTA